MSSTLLAGVGVFVVGGGRSINKLCFVSMTESVKEVTISVKKEKNGYTLSCDGTIKDAEPVNYTWSAMDVMLPSSSKEITVLVSVNPHLTCLYQFVKECKIMLSFSTQ